MFGLTLGYFGFYEYALIYDETVTIPDLVYRTVQLIGIRSGDLEGALPWQLEIARFLVPIVAGYTAFQAVISLFRDQWHQVKVRLLRRQVVICGLGERGLKLAEEFLENGYNVVVVEKDEDNPYIEPIRTEGAYVIIGDANDEYTLRRAGGHKARYLVAVTNSDGINAGVALCARDLALLRKHHALTVFIHIVDLELCTLLSGWCFAATRSELFRLEFFNVMERGARSILKEHSPFKNYNPSDQKAPRILVIGLGKMGRSLVVQTARNWLVGYAEDSRKLRVAVIDKYAERKIETLQLQYPRLNEACSFEIWQMDDNDPEFERGDFLCEEGGNCDLAAIYLCFDDDVHVLAKALTLHSKTKKFAVPIAVRMRREAGLARLIRENLETLDFDQIQPFCLLDKTCSLEALLGGTQEALARSIHEDYVEQKTKEGDMKETNPSMVAWDELPEDLKESNRSQAAHIDAKLKEIGCGIEPLTDWTLAKFDFAPWEVELLAELEHMRWLKERKRQGWKYSSGSKNLKKKTSPYLLPWQELPENVKEYDRNTVRKMPYFLGRAGYQIYRRNRHEGKN